jgi:hypothetical protein
MALSLIAPIAQYGHEHRENLNKSTKNVPSSSAGANALSGICACGALILFRPTPELDTLCVGHLLLRGIKPYLLMNSFIIHDFN